MVTRVEMQAYHDAAAMRAVQQMNLRIAGEKLGGPLCIAMHPPVKRGLVMARESILLSEKSVEIDVVDASNATARLLAVRHWKLHH
jgi:hypothetical protein